MSRVKLVLTSPIVESYRVARVLGALDKPDLREITTTLEFEEPPPVSESWSIGLIVGASGSGKTSVATSLYPGAFYPGGDWTDRAIVDEFGDRPFSEISSALNAIGFSTQTHWARPYATLSVGERYRCDLAKGLLESHGPVVVFDEFGSEVDLGTARALSIALRKEYDRGGFGVKLVALTNRRELAEYLEPDWILDAESGRLTRGRLRRGGLRVEVSGVEREVWKSFKEFHYLSGTLNSASRCYGAFLDGSFFCPGASCSVLVGFAAVLQSEGRRGRKRVHRLVVRPEVQGIGLGGAFLDALAELYFEQGYALEITTGHAEFAGRLKRSPLWTLTRVYPYGRVARHKGVASKGSFGRGIASFHYAKADNRREKTKKEFQDRSNVRLDKE